MVDEVAEVAALGLGKVRDDHVEDLVRTVLVPRFREEPISPAAGRRCSRRWWPTTCTTAWSTWPLDELHGWLRVNRVAFTDMLSERAPWWAPPRVNEAVTRKIHTESVRWLADTTTPSAIKCRRPATPPSRCGARATCESPSSWRSSSPGVPVERRIWDGAARWTRFTFAYTEPLEWVDVDPDRTIALDVSWLNNGRVVASDRRAPAAMTSRWLLAVQQVLSWLAF